MKKLCALLMFLLAVSSFGQIINIPDARLKAKLLQATTWNATAYDVNGQPLIIDANGNGEIEVSEVQNIDYLSVGSNPTDVQDYISDATGLEMFTSLTYLYISYTNLTTLNLSGLPLLTTLICTQSNLSSVHLSQMPNLKSVSLNYNSLTSLSAVDFQGTDHIESLGISNNLLTGTIDLTGFSALKNCGVNTNQIDGLIVNGLTQLEEIGIGYTQITSIDLTTLPNFKKLSASHSMLTSLDVSNNPLLTHLYLDFNQITTLDLSHNPVFFYLNIKNNNLTSLFIKNGHNDTIELNNNPSLAYICADESELFNGMLYHNALTQVNSYCSFVPGGTYYEIAGTTRFDFDGNGCDQSDIAYPNMNFSISNGTVSGNIISNTFGNYNLPVVAGSHLVTPTLENPAYFNINPTSVTVGFPSSASPFEQNFCLTPNGVHPDLEVLIIPMMLPRPGFDAIYKIIYKNKGTHPQSGTISFAFNDAVLDYVMSTPVVSLQIINYLNWDFTDLLPFETREILVFLNANSPTETPPLNGGDHLTFTASASSLATDETPVDNTFILNQTLVNSFDPNDKTCLEGNTITPGMVGKEVHYLIRFENTGTANAQNIVVKDMIDTAKFDINSLIPLSGSHSFVTKISGGNKVEFIFENINLPFDDANNDGYVAFKIKTKPTLVLGNTFSNTASIYFDYNFPIITNTATTTVALLANADFAFEDYFKIYPVPVKDVLNIEIKKSIQVSSIQIYNTLGQLVLTIPSAQQTKTVDVSSLKTGNYVVKVNSEKGSSSAKLVKL
ncbi:T9SS type A sorting domain-containing protein [Flavobacterium sp. CYK-55]|uniref:T9SS type A sorting domain-containing protein n=1 Tax=Flavobacterium sp. CYK-55 TaxID=2835529 RepID=UPI001BCE687C|nr:T9SS type A sorting domain-containing protein [Flavobacterium sp. CYK-55]MBS7787073.1 T9SS type A sorting domain-containing protein [Flavobacterium sp. CYK-55]